MQAFAADDPPPMSTRDAVSALMALSHAAAAFRAECSAYLSPAEVQRTFDAWQARNRVQLERVTTAGRTSVGAGWDRQQANDAATVREQVAGLIRPSPQSACRTSIDEFDGGVYDLIKFPDQLKVIDTPR
ncbi:hypothetical protein BH09PSE6_BH09PSE6_33130 [soil metagenome]